MNKKFWATAFTLTGTVIGAGILGLPYVFSRSGFLIGLFWLLFLGLILIFVKLCLGEVALRTKGQHQLVGYAEKYLGKTGKRLMVFAVVFGIYSALIAYLIGEGQSFSQLFFGNLNYAIYFVLGFWLVMTLLLRKGLKGLKKIETWGVLGIILIVILITIFYASKIRLENVVLFNNTEFFLPFGVVLFALLGYTSIPELRREIKGQEKQLKKAIMIGSSIPVALYILFSFVFVGVLGRNVSEVATLSFGPLVTILGIFTMLTSYFVLSFSLKDMFEFDLKYSKFLNFIFVSLIPLLLYIFIYYLKLASFVMILGIGGVVAGGLAGILILLMNKKAKLKGDRKPEYEINLKWLVIGFISLVFILGVVVEIFF